jgi:hypothetical protein
MFLRTLTRSTTGPALASLLACGARTSLYGGPPTPDAAIVDVSPGLVEASSSSDSSLPEPPPNRVSHCTVGPLGQRSPIAAVNAGGVVSFVTERGEVTTPYTFPSPASGTDRFGAYIVSRGQYVAASVVDLGGGSSGASTVSVAVLDQSGHVLLADTYSGTQTVAFGGEVALVGNASGLFVMTSGLGVTFSPTHAAHWTDPYLAYADPDEHGALLVNDQDGNSSQELYWFDAIGHTFAPTQFLTSGPNEGAAIYGTSIVYATTDPSVVWVETAQGRTAVSQGDPWTQNEYPALMVANAAPWALACWGSGMTTFGARIPLTTAPAPTPFALLPPPGASLWGPGEPVFSDPCPSVDTLGYAFQPFVTEPGIQTFRTDDGTSWSPLGEPMGGIASTSTVESGGTYLIGGSTIAGPPLYGPDGGAGVVSGAHMQLVRPATQVSVALAPADWTNQTYPAYFMTEDGGCVAYFVNGALTLADAKTGIVHTTSLTADTANDSLAIGWTNIPGDGEIWTDLPD